MKYTEEQRKMEWDNITRDIVAFIKKHEIKEFKAEWIYKNDKDDVLCTSIKKPLTER